MLGQHTADRRDPGPGPANVNEQDTRALPGIDSGLFNPATQRIGHRTHPRPDPFHRPVPRQCWIFGHRLGNHPPRSFT